jgi:multisubunit Na+/H+ antiporter MnhF subunit
VNAFLVAALGLVAGFLPLAVVLLRAPEIDGVVALQLGGVLVTLILICLGEGFHRGVYSDVPVVAAVTTWIGGIVFARFFGRYL